MDVEVIEIPVLSPDEIEVEVRRAIEEENLNSVRDLLNNQYAADIADVLERLDDDRRYDVFQTLAADLASEVLDEAGQHTTNLLLTRLPVDRVVSLLNRMPMDDLVEIMADDIPERQDEILSEMHPQTALEIREQLEYLPESAGRIMTRKYVRINEDMTAAEVLAHMRRVDSRVETVTNAYVLDPAQRLIGVISLRETINVPAQRQVKDYMETQVVSVTPDKDQEEAARMLARYDFLALPVVTEDDRMLGIITVDDAIDVLAQENTEDIMRFGAVSGEANDQPYFTVPILRVIQGRFVWLLLLFFADLITSNVLRFYDTQLATVVTLSFYIPLLIGTGGNTGAQTVSMIIRGMAVGDIRGKDVLRVMRRELFSGLILGTMLGMFAFWRVYLIDGERNMIPVVIGLSILAISAWSNMIASVIPMVTKRLGIDPAVISAPLISTLVDATGLFIYLNIAIAVLNI